MIRGVYYAPIGELGVSKKHSSAAMSFAITLGYLPALLTPIILGGLVTSPEKDAQGHIIRAFLTDTHTLGWAFVGLAILTLVSVIMSTILIMLRKKCSILIIIKYKYGEFFKYDNIYPNLVITYTR